MFGRGKKINRSQLSICIASCAIDARRTSLEEGIEVTPTIVAQMFDFQVGLLWTRSKLRVSTRQRNVGIKSVLLLLIEEQLVDYLINWMDQNPGQDIDWSSMVPVVQQTMHSTERDVGREDPQFASFLLDIGDGKIV